MSSENINLKKNMGMSVQYNFRNPNKRGVGLAKTFGFR